MADKSLTSADGLICPKGKAYLPFQREGIRFVLQHPKCLLADEMGLGKTIQAIGVVNNDPTIKRCLVICPATLKLNWAGEFEEWCTRKSLPIHIVDSKFGHAQFTLDNSVTILNYDVVVRHKELLNARQWDLLIVDEAQYCKNPKAKRTQAVLGQRAGRGWRIQPIPADRILFLSGTPILNRPVELWPLLRALDSEPGGLGSHYWSYVRRYCGAYRSRWGWDFSGSSHLNELHEKLIGRELMIRRLKKDVLEDLPSKRRQIIRLPSRGIQNCIQNELDCYDTYQQYLKKKSVSKQPILELGELAKARHDLAMAKVPHIRKLLEDALASGPVVCFAYHHDVVDALAEGFSCAILTGRTPNQERQRIVESFQSGGIDLFIGNIQAAGIGITLTRSSHIVFAEIDWTPAIITQAEDRCHRIGQRKSLLIQYPVFEGSLDERMIRIIVRKQKIISKAIDGPT